MGLSIEHDQFTKHFQAKWELGQSIETGFHLEESVRDSCKCKQYEQLLVRSWRWIVSQAEQMASFVQELLQKEGQIEMMKQKIQ